MTISDEIRELAGEAGIYSNACYKLRELARRIDDEMAELPKDKGGNPIHVGDTVYLESGSKADVKSIEFSHGEHSIVFTVRGKGFLPSPQYLSHERPDSLERIAEELDVMVESADFADDAQLADLADRIRKLAKEGEHED